jgi:hypothetical protein
MRGTPTEDAIIILIGDAKISIPTQIAQQLKAERKQNKGPKLDDDISFF